MGAAASVIGAVVLAFLLFLGVKKALEVWNQRTTKIEVHENAKDD